MKHPSIHTCTSGEKLWVPGPNQYVLLTKSKLLSSSCHTKAHHIIIIIIIKLLVLNSPESTLKAH